jgi:LysM repeat protein
LTAPQTSAPKRDFKYVVVKGDTLSSIAERYGARPSEIVMVNKLQTEKLQIGQQLTINGPSPFLSKGKLMVPIRAVVEACGGRVEWSAKHGEITVNTATTKIVFRVRQAWALVNGKAVALVQKVAMRNNRTFVPLENLKELAALPVRYEPQINRILVARLSN